MQTMATMQDYNARPVITMASLWHALRNRIAKAYCRLFHSNVSLPAYGKYHCLTCKREYDSNW